jgi:hypothetical protein
MSNVIYIKAAEGNDGNPFENFTVLHTSKLPEATERVEADVKGYAFETFYYDRDLAKAYGGWMVLDDEFGEFRKLEDDVILIPVRPMTDNEIKDAACRTADALVAEMTEWANHPRATTDPAEYWERTYQGVLDRKIDPVTP